MIVTSLVPRVSETDGAGHINNCFVPVWFEAGRREIFRALTPSLDFADWHAVLVNTSVNYEAQIFYADEVEIRTWIEHIGNKSFTVGEEIWQQGVCCARGTAIYVYYRFDRQSSAPVPPDARERLESFRRDDVRE